MLKNYFLTSLRHLLKNKTFSFINISGLALGMACFMLIISYVRFEFSFDHIAENFDNTYRVERIFYKGGQKTDHWPTTTNGAGATLVESFPEVLDMTRINWFNSDRMVRYEELKFHENHVCFADSNFFAFFNYPVIKGNRESFLSEYYDNPLTLGANFRPIYEFTENTGNPGGALMLVGGGSGSN